MEQEIIKQTGGAIAEIYKDALSPSIKPIGIMLSYLPRRIRLFFSHWEKFIINGEESILITSELLRKKMEKIPEEKICEPEPYIAIPAIQQLSYCENNDDLRDLYANLLASSMNLDKKWNVHPSFVEIIKQLNPDEAKLIKSIPPVIMIPHPLITINIANKEERGVNTLISNFTNVGLEVIENKGSICSYIENLERLKLIEIPPITSLADKSRYDELLDNPILKCNIPKGFEIKYEYKIFRMTNFGVAFANICCN